VGDREVTVSSCSRSFSIVVLAISIAPIGACALEANGLDPHGIDGIVADASAPLVDASTINADGASMNDASQPDVTTSLPDASTIDSATPDASAVDSGADADAGNPCDVDGDGHRSKDSVCLGDDCCDTDNATHPGQTGFFVTRNACGSFDYDCDGQETVESGTVNCQLGFFDCSGDGFDAPTACGVTALYTACAYAGFGCNHNEDMRAQRCH
jgi:hypothetical protein